MQLNLEVITREYNILSNTTYHSKFLSSPMSLKLPTVAESGLYKKTQARKESRTFGRNNRM
jgi:hypothetical protein